MKDKTAQEESKDRRLPLLNRLTAPRQKAQSPILLHSPQPKTTQKNSPMSKTQDDSALRPSSQNFEEERNQGSKLTQTFSESSTESLSLPKKRKRRHLGSSAPRSTRWKLEHDINLSYPSQTPKLTLLSQIDIETNNPKKNPEQRMTKTDLRRDQNCLSQICLGSHIVSSMNPETIPLVQRLLSTYEPIIRISKSANSLLVSPPERPKTSLQHNGNEFLKVKPLTLIRSCLLSTGLQLMRTGRHELEKQILLLD